MTNRDIFEIAMRQSAVDLNCSSSDFRQRINKIVISKSQKNARKTLELPFFCNLVSYGDNIVASVDARAAKLVEEYMEKYPMEHCFETPNMHVLDGELQKMGMRICFMAEYFLPDVDALKPLPCTYEIKVLTPVDFECLYTPQWGNALCEKRKQLDIMAVGAFENDKLIGLAGCSADCDTMWQIGVDVLADYRREGVAAALTSRLACEIFKLGKVPFYCAAWSNIKSVRNAIKSGFRPAWVEMTAKGVDFVSEMNK